MTEPTTATPATCSKCGAPGLRIVDHQGDGSVRFERQQDASALRTALEYATHRSYCYAPQMPCSCGLDAALAAERTATLVAEIDRRAQDRSGDAMGDRLPSRPDPTITSGELSDRAALFDRSREPQP